MKKDIATIDRKTALVKARGEFSKFKKGKTEKPVQMRREPDTARKELWCHIHQGKVSILTLKLSATEARAIRAEKFHRPKPESGFSATHSTASSQNEVMNRAFMSGADYGGCPHCDSRSFVYCNSCGALTCWNNPEDRWHKCPACKVEGKVITAKINIELEKQREAYAMPQSKHRQPSAAKTDKTKALPHIRRPLLPPRK